MTVSTTSFLLVCKVNEGLIGLWLQWNMNHEYIITFSCYLCLTIPCVHHCWHSLTINNSLFYSKNNFQQMLGGLRNKLNRILLWMHQSILGKFFFSLFQPFKYLLNMFSWILMELALWVEWDVLCTMAIRSYSPQTDCSLLFIAENLVHVYVTGFYFILFSICISQHHNRSLLS